MNCISLNCRGLGSLGEVREHRGFVKQLHPVVLFLMEMKISGKRVEKLASDTSICITILYHNLLLFMDIFHIRVQYLCYFILFCMFDDCW